MQVTDESLEEVGGVEARLSGRLSGGHLLGQARPGLGVSRGNGGGGSPGGRVHRAAELTMGSLKAQPGRKGRPGPGSELMAAEALPPRAPATPSPRQPPARPVRRFAGRRVRTERRPRSAPAR